MSDQVRRISQLLDEYESLEAQLIAAARARLISWGLVSTVLREADLTVMVAEDPTALPSRTGWRAAA